MNKSGSGLLGIVRSVMQTRMLRNLLLVAALIVVIFPVVNLFIVYPQFNKLMVFQTEKDARQLTAHISHEFLVEGAALSPEMVGDQLEAGIAGLMQDFELTKVKIFDPDGRTIFSTTPEDEGVVNEHDYFHDIVAAGSTFSKVVRKDTTSLEGELVRQDVVETYVPIMANGRFLGALELYYDNTAFQNSMDRLNRNALLLMMGIGSGLLGIIVIMAFRMHRKEAHLRQLSQAVEHSPHAVMVVDHDFVVTYVNPSYAEMTGLAADSVLQRPLVLQVGANAAETWASIKSRLVAGAGWHSELINMRANGEPYWEQVVIAPVYDEAQTISHYIVLREDISARKQIQEALKQQHQYFQALVTNSPIAIVTLNMDGRIVTCNPAFSDLFGFEREQVVEQVLDDLISLPEIGEELFAYTQQVIDGQMIREKGRRRRADGSTVDVEIFGVPVMVDGQQVGIVGLYQDISDRLAYENSLQKAKAAAEEATRAKSEFLANMSHEIRTPLNGIIGMTSLVMDTPLSSEQDEFIQTIRRSGDTLLTLINELLDFSKIEAGHLTLENHPFNLTGCIEDALDLLAPKAHRKGLELAYMLQTPTPNLLCGDVTRLRQILVNLVGNGVKFTDAGEVVVVVDSERLAKNQLRLRFAVRDTGIGIPEEKLDRLFKSFSQADASTTRKYGGTGLGLIISKRLAELMNGRMWVESVPGRGSTFFFEILVTADENAQPSSAPPAQDSLTGKGVLIVDDNETNRTILRHQTESWGMRPVLVASGAAALALLERGEKFDLAIVDMQMPSMDGEALAQAIRARSDQATMPIVLLTSLGTTAQSQLFARQLTKPIKPSQLFNVLTQLYVDNTPVTATGQSNGAQFDAGMGQAHPLRILLAEDNVVNQKVATRMLQHLGYRADVAANGLEALEALRRQPYDLVLMDVQMPEMDGVAATQEILREWPAAQRPYIIALTADALAGDRERYLAAGMDDYLSKPVSIKSLIAALHKCRPALLADPLAHADPVPGE